MLDRLWEDFFGVIDRLVDRATEALTPYVGDVWAGTLVVCSPMFGCLLLVCLVIDLR
jgi:hypothetical protein